ncbi:MAG TPA: aminopeptidase P family protein, partial [Desulfotomaculum sp.]|nr:aminopeptidase P family protein [Desulfotomaculum sp.]
MFAQRIDKLRASFAQAGIEGLVVTDTENRYYLSGFTGSAGVLFITKRTALLATDGRYIEQAKEQCPDWEIVEEKRLWPAGITRLLKENGIRAVGLEADHVSYEQWHKLADEAAGITLVPAAGLVERLRMIKEPQEITAIKRAVSLVDETFAASLASLRPGVKERDWALELEFFLRRKGAQRAAFDFIVASGWRSALPHGRAAEKAVEEGDLVVVDCGAVVGQYCSDFTRTVAVGKKKAWQEEIYRAVLAAQKAAIAAIRPGVAAKDVDQAARAVLSEQGFGGAFTHSTGHGLGLAVHEEPRLAEGVETLLEPGMVVTVEPGVYLPGKGGVRIEDVVVVTAT